LLVGFGGPNSHRVGTLVADFAFERPNRSEKVLDIAAVVLVHAIRLSEFHLSE